MKRNDTVENELYILYNEIQNNIGNSLLINDEKNPSNGPLEIINYLRNLIQKLINMNSVNTISQNESAYDIQIQNLEKEIRSHHAIEQKLNLALKKFFEKEEQYQKEISIQKERIQAITQVLLK